MKKCSTILIDERYDTSNTSLLSFDFEAGTNNSVEERLGKCSIKNGTIDEKKLYLIDDFFSPQEGLELRDLSKSLSFSRKSYGSPEAIEKGEKPAKSMNGKERWLFFSNPPQAIKQLHEFFKFLAYRLDAVITTLPWELCDQTGTSSPCTIANFIEEASSESMLLGKHQDSNPEGKIAFGIPKLYAQKEEYHPSQFVNGSEGNPWIVSVMLYATDENFNPEYQLGTAFYDFEGDLKFRANCSHMRIVLFEGDIFHTIEESKIPPGLKTWRVSYVYKLVINPRKEKQCLKAEFDKLFSKTDELVLGSNERD